jgi:hypothetical protein
MSKANERKRDWAPRMWLGSNFQAMSRLLIRNRFAVGPRYWYIAVIDLVVSMYHTLMAQRQAALLGEKLARVRVELDPIFIVGHWRSGTTFLHELLIRDQQFGYPTTFQCFEPNHFLLSEASYKRLFWFLAPSQRPMDRMPVGWDRPQEDEFALCLLGMPSYYARIAFPQRPDPYPGALDLESLSPRQRRLWQRTFYEFLRQVTYRCQRRLVLKSPPHSCRIPLLLQMFPRARFIHILRDPYVIYPSTMHLWQSLARKHCLQAPRFRNLSEDVLGTFLHLHRKLAEGKRLLAPEQYAEVRYEELVADPLGQLQRLYRQLNLGDFEQARPAFQQYLNEMAGYETNRYQLTAAEVELITQRWGEEIVRQGYPLRTLPTAAGT